MNFAHAFNNSATLSLFRSPATSRLICPAIANQSPCYVLGSNRPVSINVRTASCDCISLNVSWIVAFGIWQINGIRSHSNSHSDFIAGFSASVSNCLSRLPVTIWASQAVHLPSLAEQTATLWTPLWVTQQQNNCTNVHLNYRLAMH